REVVLAHGGDNKHADTNAQVAPSQEITALAHEGLDKQAAASAQAIASLGFTSGQYEMSRASGDNLIDEYQGGYVDRFENIALWRRLENLIYNKVDSTMVGPRKPIRPPKEVDI
ncbi:MAG: hypothetical protein ACRCTY_00485, partial [Candidatus Adiutrix sp.]